MMPSEKTMDDSTKKASWIDAKTKLVQFSHTELIYFIQKLYKLNKKNQAFIHTALNLENHALEYYKKIICDSINPDSPTRQASVSKSKQAIIDYKKAMGLPEAMIDLMILYCEEAFDRLEKYCDESPAFIESLPPMFEKALTQTHELPKEQQAFFLRRLKNVCVLAMHTNPYGIGDEIEETWLEQINIANTN